MATWSLNGPVLTTPLRFYGGTAKASENKGAWQAGILEAFEISNFQGVVFSGPEIDFTGPLKEGLPKKAPKKWPPRILGPTSSVGSIESMMDGVGKRNLDSKKPYVFPRDCGLMPFLKS